MITINKLVEHVKTHGNKELQQLENKYWSSVLFAQHSDNYIKRMYLTYTSYIKNCEHYNIPYIAKEKKYIEAHYNRVYLGDKK